MISGNYTLYTFDCKVQAEMDGRLAEISALQRELAILRNKRAHLAYFDAPVLDDEIKRVETLISEKLERLMRWN